MNSNWVIDVLIDLRKYAEKQTMFELAEYLDDTILVAANELQSVEKCQTVVNAYDSKVGTISGVPRDHRYS